MDDKYKHIKDKYEGNVDNSVLTYLRRNYPVTTHNFDSFGEKKFKYISIDDKYRPLLSKKEFTTRIYNDLVYNGKFTNLDQSVVRRTIKMYLDYVMFD
jgi:hypothetical protein